MSSGDVDVSHLSQRLSFLEDALRAVQEENKGLQNTVNEATKRIEVLEDKVSKCNCHSISTKNEDSNTDLLYDPTPNEDNGRSSPILSRPVPPPSFDCFSAAVTSMKEEVTNEDEGATRLDDENASITSDFELRLSESETEEELQGSRNESLEPSCSLPPSPSSVIPVGDKSVANCTVNYDSCGGDTLTANTNFKELSCSTSIEAFQELSDKSVANSTVNDDSCGGNALTANTNFIELSCSTSKEAFKEPSDKSVDTKQSSFDVPVSMTTSVVGPELLGGNVRQLRSAFGNSSSKAKNVSEDSFVCPTCSVQFASLAFLRAHQTYSHPPADMAHKCSLCNFSTIQRSNLKRHLRTHSGERPFSCETCNKRFSHKHNLTAHLLIHKSKDEFPHQCHLCQKKFAVLLGLRRHLDTHAGVKRIVCSECGKRFVRKYQLTRHQRKHHDERPCERLFSCTYCTLKFSDKVIMKRHVICIHTKDFPVKCEKCQTGFLYKSECSRHKCR